MSRCGASCGCDFGSKAPQAPRLDDMSLVENVLRQAAMNMLERYRRVLTGEMTEALFQERAEYLAQWWCTCLEGGHPSYAIDEEWHKGGLPDLLRDRFRLTGDTHEVLYTASLIMVNHLYEWCQCTSPEGITPDWAYGKLEELLTFWSGVFVGAPFALGDE